MASSGFFEGLVQSKATIGGVGLILAVVLLGAAFVLLPRPDRPKLRTPAILFASHIVLMIALGLLPEGSTAYSAVTVIALFLLLLVIGRSGFLVIADSVLVRRLAQPLPKIIRDILQAIIYAAILLMTLRAAGVDPSSLLTTSALLTAVIGLSLQETLGNMFAGLAIQAQEPFKVGDWIQIDDNDGLAGRVVEINWRATKIITNDEFELVVPNGAIAKASIRNFTRPSPPSRRSVRVQAPYDIPPSKVHKTILEALRDMPEVMKEPPPTVITESFADHGVGYWCRFFMRDFEHRHRIDSLVRDRIWYAFAREGISIPYPIRVTYMHDATDTRDEAEEAKRRRRRSALDRVDFLSALPKDSLDELAHLIGTRLFAAGEAIIRQGDAGDELFIVESGEVLVLLESKKGRPPLEVARLSQGEYFGEMSLMTGEARSATVRAVVETELVVVDKAAFQKIVEHAPRVLDRISKSLAERQDFLKSSTEKTHPGAVNLAEESHLLLRKIRRFFALG